MPDSAVFVRAIHREANDFLDTHGAGMLAAVTIRIPSDPISLAIITTLFIVIGLVIHAYWETRPNSPLQAQLQEKIAAAKRRDDMIGERDQEIARLKNEGIVNQADTPILVVNGGNGTKLTVEARASDAVNVRLVAAEGENYVLVSEVIRHLKLGEVVELVLHSEPKAKTGSLVLQRFSSPALFFKDLHPEYTGSDIQGKLQHAISDVNTSQMAVTLQIAYSNPACTKHLRGTYRIRWRWIQERIADIEPLGVRIDDDPPLIIPRDAVRQPSRST